MNVKSVIGLEKGIIKHFLQMVTKWPEVKLFLTPKITVDENKKVSVEQIGF